MKKVYRLFGIPVWSVETKLDKPGQRYSAQVQLTAADNGGDTTSTPMQVFDEDIPYGDRAGFTRRSTDAPANESSTNRDRSV